MKEVLFLSQHLMTSFDKLDRLANFSPIVAFFQGRCLIGPITEYNVEEPVIKGHSVEF